MIIFKVFPDLSVRCHIHDGCFTPNKQNTFVHHKKRLQQLVQILPPEKVTMPKKTFALREPICFHCKVLSWVPVRAESRDVAFY